MSNFAFLKVDFPEIHASAKRAEYLAVSDPRASAFYSRRSLEVLVKWAFKHDPGLKFPYQNNLSALVHEPTFKNAAGQAVFSKAKLIISIGNRAVHEARETPERDARQAVSELFHVCYWLARTYGRTSTPASGLAFDPKQLTRRDDIVKQAFIRLQQMQEEMEEKDEDLAKVLRDKNKLDENLKSLQDEIARVRAENERRTDTHDYSEAATRDYFIDVLLHEAGWPLEKAEDREYRVTGMPNPAGEGFVDYVLWGDDGKPLGLVEAKRTRRDAREGQQQAKLYADCLENEFGQRPVIFYTNGYDHWIWDDTTYPPRAIQGFLKKDELQLLVQRRTVRKSLVAESVDPKIAGRYYQSRAIKNIASSFETERQRKALLVMATGSGKTRTVIALTDLLIRCNWVKRVLFLADRVSLVEQAAREFKKHLPDAAPVNLIKDKSANGRVYLSTYPTMMGLIDQKREEGRLFGVGHFDLIVIDEAHRSVYQRYRAIFDYFDSLLVGLTATPKNEIDRNTYSLFDLEDNVPTDAYSLDEAVRDEYLVPPESISVPLKFQREGIRYDDLSEDEKTEWDMLEWDEEEPPETVNAEAVNRWLFNTDTVDKVLAHLMAHGLKVNGGDTLGKTIIFAKNQKHAEFIEERFNKNYPHMRGHFARIITFKETYAQSLLDDFSTKDKNPQLAISVDMLDTGIDVPEVVNLVLFKLIRSKTKFWQIIGRGTRLCEDLFGPGLDKECFYVFDFCQNLEFFSQNPKISDGTTGKSLTERLFSARLDLVRAIEEKQSTEIFPGLAEEGSDFDGQDKMRVPLDEDTIREDALNHLIDHVAAMNIDNFLVRPKRKSVEKFQKRDSWNTLSDEKRDELLNEVAGLPTERPSDKEEAKRFDLLLFSLELAVLKAAPSFERLRKQLVEIASALEEQTAIPAIAAQAELIQEIQTEDWWAGVTVPILELTRRRLRDLVQHIDKKKKKIVYSNFEDEIGTGNTIDLPQAGDVDYRRFKRKARHFLLDQEEDLVLQKLRRGKPLTSSDINHLQNLLKNAGVGEEEQLEHAADLHNGLGRFIRSLIGLERSAVAEAFSEFTAGSGATADQIEFVGLIVEHLTEKGVMEPEILYESPFTDIAPSGLENVFSVPQADKLFEVIKAFNESAVG